MPLGKDNIHISLSGLQSHTKFESLFVQFSSGLLPKIVLNLGCLKEFRGDQSEARKIPEYVHDGGEVFLLLREEKSWRALGTTAMDRNMCE